MPGREGRADGERQGARGVRESLQPDPNLVTSDPEIRKPEAAFLIRDRLAGHVRLGFPRTDLGAWHDGAQRIDDTAAHAGRIDGFLRR